METTEEEERRKMEGQKGEIKGSEDTYKYRVDLQLFRKNLDTSNLGGLNTYYILPSFIPLLNYLPISTNVFQKNIKMLAVGMRLYIIIFFFTHYIPHFI